VAEEVGPGALLALGRAPCLGDPRLTRCLEVAAEHQGGLVRQVKDRFPCLLRSEPRPKGVGEVAADGLRVVAPALRAAGERGDPGRVAVEVETVPGQGSQLCDSSSGAEGDAIRDRPVGTGHPEDVGTSLGRVDEAGGFVVGERSALVSPVRRGVEAGEVRQGIGVDPTSRKSHRLIRLIARKRCRTSRPRVDTASTRTLARYVDVERLSIDNNAAERALRNVAIGHKNWTFAGHDEGAEALAIRTRS
jgi:hypothetical protein